VGTVEQVSVGAMCELIKELKQVGHYHYLEPITIPSITKLSLLARADF